MLGRLRALVRGIETNEGSGDIVVRGRGEFAELMRDMISMRTAIEDRAQTAAADLARSAASTTQCSADASVVAESTKDSASRIAASSAQLSGAALSEILQNMRSIITDLEGSSSIICAACDEQFKSAHKPTPCRTRWQASSCNCGP